MKGGETKWPKKSYALIVPVLDQPRIIVVSRQLMQKAGTRVCFRHKLNAVLVTVLGSRAQVATSGNGTEEGEG